MPGKIPRCQVIGLVWPCSQRPDLLTAIGDNKVTVLSSDNPGGEYLNRATINHD